MSKLDRVILQLEEGKELCGVCGKDVTDTKDCMHTDERPTYSSSEHAGYQLKMYSIRIGMEALLYGDEYLLTLPYFDVVNRDPVVEKFYRALDTHPEASAPPILLSELFNNKQGSETVFSTLM